jgi:hypothetical protein
MEVVRSEMPSERGGGCRGFQGGLPLNNCFRDQAVSNARQLADLLRGADVPAVPPGA